MKHRVDQEWRNRKKMIRSVLRLKYAIAADNHIQEVLEVEHKRFYKAVQNRDVLPPFNPEKLLGL